MRDAGRVALDAEVLLVLVSPTSVWRVGLRWLRRRILATAVVRQSRASPATARAAEQFRAVAADTLALLAVADDQAA